jgi:hypothetical protein
MVAESEYYPFIADFIKRKFNCLSVGTNRGYLSLGLVDVIGAYEVGGRFLCDLELMFVEVKTSTSSFGKSIGQALGYSAYGERCYLGIPFEGEDTFTDEQVFMADHLGVGLMRVQVDGSKLPTGISIPLVSRRHIPIPGHKMYLLRSIGIARCHACGSYALADNMELDRRTSDPSLFNDKGTKELYLCRACYEGMTSEPEKAKRKMLKERARRAVRSRKENETPEPK